MATLLAMTVSLSVLHAMLFFVSLCAIAGPTNGLRSLSQCRLHAHTAAQLRARQKARETRNDGLACDAVSSCCALKCSLLTVSAQYHLKISQFADSSCWS